MEQPSAPEVKKVESGDQPEQVDKEVKGEGEAALKAEDIPLPTEQEFKQEGLCQTTDESLNKSALQNVEDAEEEEIVQDFQDQLLDQETTPSDSAATAEVKASETVEAPVREDKSEKDDTQKAGEAVKEESSEQSYIDTNPEDVEQSDTPVEDQPADDQQMQEDLEKTQPLIMKKEENTQASAAQDDSHTETTDDAPVLEQQPSEQNSVSLQEEQVETVDQTNVTPLTLKEDHSSPTQQDTVDSSLTDQPKEAHEAHTQDTSLQQKDEVSEKEPVGSQETTKDEAPEETVSEPVVEPHAISETSQGKHQAETQATLDTAQVSVDTTQSSDTEKKTEEAQQAKSVEDELDSLTNMIGHMALSDSAAQSDETKEEADIISHETPEEQHAKMEALPGAADLSDVQPPEELPSEDQQPGASHPEPYRLTQDNCSSEKEMKEAISVAAAAEKDLESARASSPSSSRKDPPNEMLHHIKQIEFKDKKVGIVTQNENGPCPLVAILNVLLLRWEIELPPPSDIVSAAKLMEYIGHVMLESVPKDLSGEIRLNYEQNMHDAMAVLPKLQTGLDVNVKFTGVRDFEYTPECIIFDLLRIPLYHGWLVDPQDKEVAKAVGQAGYNQLVEKVISQKCSTNEDQVTEALIIENFLERTASQLTYHGLTELNAAMNEGEIGVLFRNNHFSTIYKHQKELLQLVTDQGFLGESNVVWETLSSIDGDEQFVDNKFRTVPPKPEPEPASSSPNTSQLTAEQQIDHDFLVALSLQDEPQPAAQEEGASMSEEEKTTQEKADEELARQLQQEEERQAEEEAARAATPPRQQQQQQPQEAPNVRSPQQKKKDNCNIL